MRGIAMAAGLIPILLAGCAGGEDLVTGTTLSVGTYQVTSFRITPDDLPFIDVQAAGGSLTISIDQNAATTGTLVLPATIPGGPVNAKHERHRDGDWTHRHLHPECRYVRAPGALEPDRHHPAAHP